MYTWKSYFVVQADYQHWANDVLFDALDHLKPEAMDQYETHFHTSIRHSISHMLASVRLWCGRLKGADPTPDQPDTRPAEWRELKIALRAETRNLQNWLESQPDAFFEGRIAYSERGGDHGMWVRDALNQLFTHTAQHRGEISVAALRLGAPHPEMDYVLYRRHVEKLLNEARVLS